MPGIPEPRLSKPETNPFYLWIEHHPWWIGIITFAFTLCVVATIIGLAYLLSLGALDAQPASSASS